MSVEEAAGRSVLTRLVREVLPREHVCFATGYGSGVFAQRSQLHICDQKNRAWKEEKPVLDCLLVVGGGRAALEKWHAANLARNSAHYGGILAAISTNAQLPHRLLQSAMQIGCGMHFVSPFDATTTTTTMTGGAGDYTSMCADGHDDDDEIERVRCKYGVLGIDDAIDDLQSWKMLAFAGRMQKPTMELALHDCRRVANDDDDAADTKRPEDEEAHARLMEAQTRNLRSALATALLLLPDEFGERELFRSIVGLSYGGDVRVVLGAERLTKVSDIAEGSAAGMRAMYAELISSMLDRVVTGHTPEDHVYRSALNPHELVRILPEWPRKECAALLASNSGAGTGSNTGDADAIWHACRRVATRERSTNDILRTHIRLSLRRIVFRSSARMLLHAALTTNATRAVTYAYAKLAKRLLVR